MKVSAGEHAKKQFRCRISPINCVSAEGPVPSHYPFRTRPAAPQACRLPIDLFLPLHPVLSLGSGYVHTPPASSILLCQLLRYFPGAYYLLPYTPNFLLSPSPTPFLLLHTPHFVPALEIQLLKLTVEGGDLPKSKLTGGLPLLQIQDSPALLIRLNCFQLTNITSCCCFFFFFF